MRALSAVNLLLALGLSPLLLGIINRTKAVISGRSGRPLLQVYFDLAKLLGKGAVYSRTTTWVFKAGPIVGLAAVLAALAVLPLGGVPALVAFPGDVFVLVAFLGLARFALICGALDTGSSFEGMGASREAAFSALAEPALLLALLVFVSRTGTYSLSRMYVWPGAGDWLASGPVLILVVIALFILLLSENSRIPVDDPNTHLELTMIHEVMVLDHGGPDLAFILYAAALKLWLFSALVVGAAVPTGLGSPLLDELAMLAGMGMCAVAVGLVESTMARLRLPRVPQLLTAAGAFAALALAILGR
jgi:formate hydrogenlyase subunit 4